MWTATTVAVVTIAKFASGAWVTTLLIPAMVILMISVQRHYHRVQAETANPLPLDLTGLRAPLVVVPILYWNKIAQKALRFALNLSAEVRVLHVDCEKDTGDFARPGAAWWRSRRVSLSLRDFPDCRLCSGARAEPPGPADRRVDSGVRGTPLV